MCRSGMAVLCGGGVAVLFEAGKAFVDRGKESLLVLLGEDEDGEEEKDAEERTSQKKSNKPQHGGGEKLFFCGRPLGPHHGGGSGRNKCKNKLLKKHMNRGSWKLDTQEDGYVTSPKN